MLVGKEGGSGNHCIMIMALALASGESWNTSIQRAQERTHEKWRLEQRVLTRGSNTTTPTPTMRHTMEPTPGCLPGEFLIDGAGCFQCEIGRYQEHNMQSAGASGVPFPSNCSLCPLGSFNTRVGLASCRTCDIGRVATDDRTSCTDCKAGGYTYMNRVRGRRNARHSTYDENKENYLLNRFLRFQECKTCVLGKYAPSAQDNDCLSCPAGFATDNTTGAMHSN